MSWCLSSKDGVKARKIHRCDLCGEKINAGDIYDSRSGVGDGRASTMHMHPECHAYEQIPGNVNPDWYEDITEPAFNRADVIAAMTATAK